MIGKATVDDLKMSYCHVANSVHIVGVKECTGTNGVMSALARLITAPASTILLIEMLGAIGKRVEKAGLKRNSALSPVAKGQGLFGSHLMLWTFGLLVPLAWVVLLVIILVVGFGPALLVLIIVLAQLMCTWVIKKGSFRRKDILYSTLTFKCFAVAAQAGGGGTTLFFETCSWATANSAGFASMLGASEINVSIAWLEGLSLRLDASFQLTLSLVAAVFGVKAVAAMATKAADMQVGGAKIIPNSGPRVEP